MVEGKCGVMEDRGTLRPSNMCLLTSTEDQQKRKDEHFIGNTNDADRSICGP